MQSIKEHNLKANHNCKCWQCNVSVSVCNLSKNTIWKQITTKVTNLSIVILCMQSIKEHNLKANHNSLRDTPRILHLYAIYQRTQSESKSQRVCGILPPVLSVCNLSKNTIWKQITTKRVIEHLGYSLYAIYQRTQSESKSQQTEDALWLKAICMQSIKEHNLKANHNQHQIAAPFEFLYAIYQRTQSESKSQLLQLGNLILQICMQSIKEHNLKANHNSISI